MLKKNSNDHNILSLKLNLLNVMDSGFLKSSWHKMYYKEIVIAF